MQNWIHNMIEVGGGKRLFLACNIISPIELYIIYFTEKYTVK